MNNDTIYALLKVIQRGKEPKKEDVGGNFQAFASSMEEIHEKRLASNISFSRGGQGNPIRIVYANGLELTNAGKRYIELIENNS